MATFASHATTLETLIQQCTMLAVSMSQLVYREDIAMVVSV